MKTAISVPDKTFEAVEQAAERLGVSRSHFYAQAARRWLDELDDESLTEQINASLEGVDQDDGEFARVAAARTLAQSEW